MPGQKMGIKARRPGPGLGSEQGLGQGLNQVSGRAGAWAWARAGTGSTPFLPQPLAQCSCSSPGPVLITGWPRPSIDPDSGPDKVPTLLCPVTALCHGRDWVGV